ncbi:MAG TPA: hypothetical protein VN241_00785 [Microbacterium sp.]|nr:hypothetical protein [Microbacterium sp.]
MRFHHLRSSSDEWLQKAESGSGQSFEAARASRALTDDYGRWSRWGLGLAAFVLFWVGSTLVAVPVTIQSRAPFWVLPPSDVIFMVVGVLACAWALSTLWRLHRSGRRLTRALGWWLRAPYRAGAARDLGGWIDARRVNFEPPMFARITTGTLAALLAILTIAGTVREAQQQDSILIGVLPLWGVLSLACTIGQFGGVMRVASGAAEADPLWVRIRDAFRRH